MRYVSRNVRLAPPSVSINVRRKSPIIARPADHHCKPLQLTAFLGLASRRIAHHCADILLLDVAATSIFEIFEEFGTESPDRIGRETRFIDISTDSLSFVNASIALEGYLGFIPPRWDQLSLAELEELKHVAHV